MSSASGSLPGTPLSEADHDARDVSHSPSEEREVAPRDVEDFDDDDENLSDSDLSDVDEAQFEDFDPANVAIEDRPAIAVDETNVALLGVHKRKRPAGAADDDGSKKKKKEGTREKPKKNRKKKDEDDLSGGEEVSGKRERPKKAAGERREKAKPRERTPENESELTPEERRRRALDRAMDVALRNPNKGRRRQDGVSLEDDADAIIDNLRQRMIGAAEADNESRKAGLAAHQKLKLLPEVVALLNRTNLQHAIVDPEANLMESVRFFLEPLSDGSLPAYNIQRDLFAALAKLPINHETLVASGLGKVALFYTKSKRPEVGIKRQAERLLGEWSRPILKRTDDYRKRQMVSAEYDPTKLPVRSGASQRTPAQEREAALALPVRNPNRAQMQTGVSSYKIVPKSVVSNSGAFARPMGASGDDKFRRMKARQMGKAVGGKK
ncbi:MAG: Transcription factor iws1 [Thelocarpon superellum]|nr:MAG: Transcription factor iws1 [Thelocarpon superellum]